MGVLAAVVIAVAVVLYIIVLPPAVATQKEHPAVVTQTVIPTNLDQVRSWFGPWELAKPGTTGAPGLVMLMPGGGIDRSGWTFQVDSGWKAADPPQITNVSPGDKQVQFQSDDGETYALSYGQPFILQRFPQQAYAFTKHGSSYTIVSISAEELHRIGHKG